MPEPLSPLSALAGKTDCALWAPAATAADVETLCAAAARHHFRAVCVNGSRVELASSRLEEAGVKRVALIGFPLGAADADAKRYEVELAVDQGAQELEVVVNFGRLKEGDHKYVLRELRDLAEAADERPLCVAVESKFLTREELVQACHLVLDSGADSLAIGTGFWHVSATLVEEVKFLRQALGPKFGLKAFVGTLTAEMATALQEAGATRFGTLAAL